MTPAELREWVDSGEEMTTDVDSLLFKLTDPTPIDQEFAERVRCAVDWHVVRDCKMYVIHATHGDWVVTTRGDVYTLLFRAGLLDQLESE